MTTTATIKLRQDLNAPSILGQTGTGQLAISVCATSKQMPAALEIATVYLSDPAFANTVDILREIQGLFVWQRLAASHKIYCTQFGDKLQFDDIYNRELKLMFSYDGSVNQTPPGFDVGIENTGDPAVTWYHTVVPTPYAAPLLPANPPAPVQGFAVPVVTKTYSGGTLTLSENYLIDFHHPAGPELPATCGNCKLYSMLHLRCDKTGKRVSNADKVCDVGAFRDARNK